MATSIFLNGYVETDCGSSKSAAQLGKALFHLIAIVSGNKILLQNVNEAFANGS